LKIETQILPDHQAQLTVEIDPSTLEAGKHRAARRLSQRAKIPGFRPGKAPYAVLVRFLGEEAILEEAIDLLVQEIYPQALKESEVEPYGPGSLKEIKSMDPPTFEFLVPLAAKVDLGDYSTIRLPYEPRQVSETEVQDVIQRLQTQNAVIEPVERPIQAGDRVSIQISAQRLEPKDGEDPTLIKERTQSVDIQDEESDASYEWPFPGFSRQLIGLSAGESTAIQKTLPEDYQIETLRGVTAEYNVTIKDVKSRTLPEANDELAKSLGEYSTMDELHDAIRQDLEAHATGEYHQEYDDKILEKILEVSTIKYPQQMLEHEIDLVIERLQERLQQQNMDLDLYLKTREMDMEALRSEAKPVAEARLKRTLTLIELAEKEKIDVKPDELESQTVRMLDEYSRYLPEKEFRKLAARENANNLVSNVMMEMMIDKTLQRIRQIARGIESSDTDLSPESEKPQEIVNLSESTSEAVPVASAEVQTASATEEETKLQSVAPEPTGAPAADDIASTPKRAATKRKERKPKP